MNVENRVIVTGANRGIGLALCGVFKNRGYEVIGACRQVSEALKALSIETIDQVEVTSNDGIANLTSGLRDRKIGVLINNAGILRSQSYGHFDFDAMREQFEVNTLGPLKVIEALDSNLPNGAKIAVITSRMGSIEDNTSGGAYGYRMSKCALNAACKSLSIDLAHRKLAVGILHPGWVETDMTNNTGQMTTEASAANLFDRIDQLNFENSGTFWHCNGEILPW